jgi:hypothetical protein
MIKFELKFKNKPVKAHVKEDGVAALYFDNGEWLFLQNGDSTDKYKVKDGNFSPAKEDLALLGKLLNKGLKDYERMHHFKIEFNGRKIEVEKNEVERYYIKFPEGALFIIAQRKGTEEWYQEQFDEPLRPIYDLQTIGQLIRDKEEDLASAVPGVLQ